MYSQIILTIAKMIGVPTALLLAICTHESNLKNVVRNNDSGSPTYGICQVKKSTAEFLGYKGEGEGLMSPKTNVKYAALYLKYQLDRYDGDINKAIAAYNAGSFNESSPGIPRNLRYLNTVLNIYYKCIEPSGNK
jgi:soluble lytic murein transglycosylase